MKSLEVFKLAACSYGLDLSIKHHLVLPISVELDRMFVGCIQDTSHLEEWLDLYRLGRAAQRRAGSYR